MLSIQSHVVHGYVGNKVAAFVMQVLGVDVDPLQVVEFSNHTGYSAFRGRRVPAEEVQQLVEGLRLNNFIEAYDGVLSGYIGNVDVIHSIKAVLDEINELRANRLLPRCSFICDPVLGDNGKFYVTESVVDTYRTLLVPRADVVTPNGFEASVLTQIGSQIGFLASVDEARAAANRLHDMGAPFVVIKSFSPPTFGNGEEICFLTSVKGQASVTQRLGRVPKQVIYFSGTGDVFAAALTARLQRSETWRDFLRSGRVDISTATAHLFHETVEVCMRMMRAIITNSLLMPTERETPRSREIRVIQNLDSILRSDGLPVIPTVCLDDGQ